MKFVKLGLTVVILSLAAWLAFIIYIPQRYDDIKKKRYSVVIERLEEIKLAQTAFKEVNGIFASNWDRLINTIKTDSFQVIKTIGNPDDTNIVTFYDTSFLAIADSLFPAPYAIDSLAFIPYSNGSKFLLNSGHIIKAQIKVQVYEVQAPDSSFMNDLMDIYGDYIDRTHVIQLGSMYEATTSGNWE